MTGKIADCLAERGHTVYIGTRRVRGRNLADYPHLKFIEYIPGRYHEFELALNEAKPDLIFVYSDDFDFMRQIVFYERCKRFIVALCGANWLYSNRNYVKLLLYRCAKRLEHIICHSEYDRDYKLCSVSRLIDKTVIIPNGVDMDEFDKNTLTRQNLMPEHADKPWLLSVSNFFPGKGQHHLVDIFNQLPPKEKFVYIQVASDIDFPVGERLEKEWLKHCKLKLNKNIEMVFKKNISREEVIGFFSNSNVFVFPSEKEVAPIVLLEAMAASLPWVAADVGNTRALAGGRFISAIRDGRYHSVFDGRVKSLMAKAVTKLYKRPTVGEEGRKKIADDMNWDKILPQYLSLIERHQNA